MVQDVLVLQSKEAAIQMADVGGPHPVRYFPPVPSHLLLDDSSTDGGGMYTDGQTPVNPTQKSLLQMEFLIRACHQTTGGWVVDLCCGSGTGVIAALRNQLNVVGFDIMQRQVDFAKKRVETFLESEKLVLQREQEARKKREIATGHPVSPA